MKILSITAQKPGSTGSGVYLTELVKEYALAGHEQAVVAGVYREDKAELPEGVLFYPVYFCSERLPFPIAGMSDEMPYKSTRYCDMTPEMTERFLREFLSVIRRAVEELKPDLILCHHLYLLTAAVREHFPEHRIYGFCHNTDLRQMRKTALKQEYIREQIKELNHIFVPQKAQEESVKEIYRVSGERITRVGMGYNSAVFYRAWEKQKGGEQKKDGMTRLVFAGKIAEKKGVISLIRSLSLLDFPKDMLKLYLAGSTGNEAEYKIIRELAENCRYQVEFLGRLSQTELAQVYNQCDIFVLPSFFEGIPLTVIEALACGNRVVMTDFPGIREWLEEAAPGADVRYVEMPEMRNTDEPVPESLPEFERRLARELKLCIGKKETGFADVSRISWSRIAERVIERKDDRIMKIAVTYENGNVFQHFGHTGQFKVYDVRDGRVADTQVVDTKGSGHGALAGMLAEKKVDTLICGGIGAGAQTALAEAGIRLYGGVSGNADEAVESLLAGKLVFNPDVHCDHHGHGQQGEEHHHGSCHCMEDKHGCTGNGDGVI